jgi:hypothetical protein
VIKFSRIAHGTGQCEIAKFGAPAPGLREDVIHFKGIVTKILRRLAILTQILRPLNDFSPQLC